MFPKFYYKLLCFDKNIIGQIGVQGLNKYLNLPYKIGLIWGGVGPGPKGGPQLTTIVPNFS